MEYFANEKSIKERLQLYFFKNQKSSNLNFVLNEVGKFKFKKMKVCGEQNCQFLVLMQH